ncbi:DUF2974 domain-containing protein [Periweissella cryptocerci]|uniref:DUF2974 domain-containing protein n=1 Tax=Periweissella cryptocerci TaxID=2506420 RepID=A0A4V1AIJ3_9LACO|nr:lipase family protein [Periweissella cryptocerci]QBO35705.1 DUF2974 domain-containing protein [Periweissella cryptocerci]
MNGKQIKSVGFHASWLAKSIEDNQVLSPDYKKHINYLEAGFNSDVSAFSSQGIHHGLIGETKDLIVISFKGTKSWDDWKNNVKIKLVRFAEGEGRVHTGFYQAVRALDSRLWEVFQQIDNSEKRILITGHSKGGAMAQIFARMLVNHGVDRKRINVVTFGSPRVGDVDFASDITWMIDIVRYEANFDIVPGLPPAKSYLSNHEGLIKDKVDWLKWYSLRPIVGTTGLLMNSSYVHAGTSISLGIANTVIVATQLSPKQFKKVDWSKFSLNDLKKICKVIRTNVIYIELMHTKTYELDNGFANDIENEYQRNAKLIDREMKKIIQNVIEECQQLLKLQRQMEVGTAKQRKQAAIEFARALNVPEDKILHTHDELSKFVHPGGGATDGQFFE